MLGQELKRRKLVTQEMIDLALREQVVTQELIGDILVRMGFVSRDNLRQTLLDTDSQALGHDHSHAVLNLPPDFLKRTRTIIQGDPADKLYVSTLYHDPAEVARILEEHSGKNVEIVPTGVRHILKRLHNEDEGIPDDPMTLVEEEDVSRILNSVITAACAEKASDIHIIPTDRSLHIDVCIDGVPYNQAVFPLAKADQIVAAIKVRAGMDVSEKMVSQDGGYPFYYKDRTIDLRVSTLLLESGEKVTIRLLDKEDVMKDIGALGISMLDDYLETARLANGIVLVCGPTGSGKSTTLYSTLMTLDRMRETINTIEDPIEYRLPGIQQSAVNNKLNPPMTFASFTRTILRHAPRRLVVGEIRDRETAVNAFNAAETGHAILSTLHTTDVVASIARILGFGVERSLVPLLLKGVLVQRLARKICTFCEGMGCNKCRDGYRGRTLISEFARFRKSDDVQAALDGRLSYRTLAEDARAKVASGITDCAEISRISDGCINLCNGGSCIAPSRDRCAKRMAAS